MKIYIAHNFYQNRTPSGENSAVRSDLTMLKDHGHDVRQVFTTSDGISYRELFQVRFGLGSRRAVRPLEEAMVNGWTPEVLHIHNVFPLITTEIVRFALDAGIPVVQTLHNYRRSCAAGTHFRAGRICESCSRRNGFLPGVLHGCYRSSRLQTVPVVVNQVREYSLWPQLSAHLVLTDYMRDRLVEQGIPRDRVIVRETVAVGPVTTTEAGSGLLFVGRLSVEKGVPLLVDSWLMSRSQHAATLTIIGTGPCEALVARAAESNASIRFVGRQEPNEVATALEECAAVVVPSLWYEGFPTVVSEAFSHGRPVIAVRTPNAESWLRGAGWLADGSPDELAATIDHALENAAESVERGTVGRFRYERDMTVSASYRKLMRAYEIAVGH